MAFYRRSVFLMTVRIYKLMMIWILMGDSSWNCVLNCKTLFWNGNKSFSGERRSVTWLWIMLLPGEALTDGNIQNGPLVCGSISCCLSRQVKALHRKMGCLSHSTLELFFLDSKINILAEAVLKFAFVQWIFTDKIQLFQYDSGERLPHTDFATSHVFHRFGCSDKEHETNHFGPWTFWTLTFFLDSHVETSL